MTHQFILTEDFNPTEKILKAIFLVNGCYNFVNKVAGLFGLVILMPILALVTLSLWVLLKYHNHTLNKLINHVFREIDTANNRALMEAHLALKKKRIETDAVLGKTKKGESFFLLAPLINQIKYSRTLFRKAEDRLHKSAYPHLYQPLTDSQIKELENYSKNMVGIWEESDYVRN